MQLTDQNGNTHELNDLVNLDLILGRYFENRYFSEKNAKEWKSKVTHFCKNSGYFRERIKAPISGFCYKIGKILPDGKIMQIYNHLTATDSLKTYRDVLRFAAHPNN
jgi:hypothetical protein